ncbi:hypothetical protein BIW11_05238 [Tropilaelaps mercedesae]|uniref:Uncharacterized protein n=1 Tax=Tropilaelaps mercedesae TaxID=418985 RepID=A0A1V9Y352_9ACAR|nr:hypothetical protein BIW11_05238 [Tropilaelaps mercedesae]
MRFATLGVRPVDEKANVAEVSGAAASGQVITMVSHYGILQSTLGYTIVILVILILLTVLLLLCLCLCCAVAMLYFREDQQKHSSNRVRLIPHLRSSWRTQRDAEEALRLLNP